MMLCLQEIHVSKRFTMSVEEEGFVHKLVIENPTRSDNGQVKCDINGVTTSANLDVKSKKISPIFIYRDVA